MLLARSNFMIINNSFSVKLCRQNAGNRIFGKVQFQNFPVKDNPGLSQGWLIPSGGPHFNYGGCLFLINGNLIGFLWHVISNVVAEYAWQSIKCACAGVYF